MKLQIRPISAQYLVHPNKDPGCLLQSADLLHAQRGRYAHALVVFDREGCGQESLECAELEHRVRFSLDGSGWQGRCDVVAIHPELDSWVWSDSNQVDVALGWFGRIPSLRSWLADEGLMPEGATKPPRPKEALEAALRLVRKRRTSAIYSAIARTVSFQRCTDPAFLRLVGILRGWFGAENHQVII
jgi:hypothetical protein